MIFSLRGARPGSLRIPFAAARLLSLWLGLMCVAPLAMAQLKVGQPIDFGTSAVGTPITLTIVFSATTATTVTSASVLTDGAIGQDFTPGADTCAGTTQQNSTCSVKVTFTPKQVGVRHGVLLLYNGTTLINQVFLHGIGSGGAFAFAPANVTSLNTAPALTPSTFTAGAAVEDGNGNFFFTDVQNSRILEQSAQGVISPVASLPVTSNSSIAIGPDGTLYVSAQSSVYAFLPGATPTPVNTGSVTLTTPTGLAVDAVGDLYIADAALNQISMYSMSTGSTSVITTVGLSPGLSSPKGLAVDASGNLYVSDSGNDRVVEVASGIDHSTILTVTGLTLNNPIGLTLDPAGTVYVADTGNQRIVEITVNGVTFALSDPNLLLTTPTGVLMKPNGDLLVSDSTNGLVLVPRSIPSVKFPTPTIVGSLDTTDGALALTLQATGNSVAQLVYPTSGTEPTISTAAFALTNAGTCPSVNEGNPYTPLQFPVGDICTYTIDFTPLVQGLNSANFEIDISLPGGSATYTTIVPLTGYGISSIASFSLVVSPSTTTVGKPVSLTLTALNAGNTTATDYNGTVTFTSTDPTAVFLGGTSFTFTAADKGVLVIPAASGIQFNHNGTFTVSTTDGTFSATSNAITVLDGSTVSSFTSSVNPSLPNQTTTLIATVASSTPGGPVPTGMVSFYNGTVLLGTATLVNGVAQLPASFSTPGSYSLTAVYAGDGNTAGSTSGVLTQTVVSQTSATAFTSSVNPSLVNQSTVLTLTLSTTGPAPTGTVKFYDGATLIGTGTVSSNAGSATVSFSTAGTHALTAVYSGDSNNSTVTATLNQVVLNPVTITLASTVNPSLVGQQTSLSATVTSSNAPPTGSVKFYDGTTLLGSSPLTGGVATLPATFTTPGIHSITAVYTSGDSNNIGATSAPYAQDVDNSTVITSFTSSVNPSIVGQSTTLSLSLAASGTSPAPTGTVKFYNGSTLLGTAAITNGVATLPVSFATAGSFPLTAVYSGDNYNASITAGPLTQVVVAAATAITLSSNVNPVLLNANTQLRAVIANYSGAPGTIYFYDGATLLGSAPIAGGVAVLTVSFSTVGLHSLTAVFNGDGTDTSATSPAYSQDVVSQTTVASFTSSVNPSTIGQSTTLTLTITGTSPGGTVKFYNGTTLLGTASVTNGVATLPVSFATAGTFQLTAVYSGDNNNAGLTAGPLTQVVVNTAPTVTVTSSANPSLVNTSVALTATLSSTTAGGSVKFYDGTTLLGTSNVVAGVATLPYTFTTLGLHSISAVYSGDNNNPTAISPAYSQDVVTPTSVASFTSSVNPSTVGQSTTLTLTVTGTNPGGTVKFYNGTTLLGTAPVSNGVGSLPVSFATAGSFPLTAVYSGDNNNAGLSAGPLTQVVTNTAPTVTVSSSANPSLVNTSVSLIATLSPATANGAVKFYDGTTLLGTSNVAAGVATLPYTFTTLGLQSITAVYSGSSPTATSAAYSQDVVTQTTVASFTSSLNPSTVGQSTTLTLTVTGTSPGGSAKFYNGTTLLGTAQVNNGVATLPVSFPTAGSFPLTAVYSGDNNNSGLTAGPLTQVVVNAAPTVTVSSSTNPSLVNTSVSLTATLSTTTAGGSVKFYDGTTLLGTANVGAGVATLPYTFTTLGIQSITAVYSGDNSNPTATSQPYSQDVVSPTAVASFTSSVNPSTVGQSTTLTLTITGTNPGGTVKFYNGATLLGTAPLNNGVATLPISFPNAGSFPLTAVYPGDNNNAGLTAGPLTQVVTATATTVTLTSSVNPSLLNATTQLTATLVPATASGSISFYDGTTLLGTAHVLSGAATLPASFSTVGIHSLTAVYSGDNNDTKATSAAYSQDVQNPDSAVLTSSPNPVLTGQSATLTATIASAGQTPTGTVTFYDGTTPVGTGSVTNGVAAASVTFTTVGTHNLTCKYAGDTNDAPASCNTVSEDVQDAATLALTSSKNPSLVNQSVTFTATVGSAGPTPTGTVKFYSGTTLIGTGTLAGGTTSVALTFTTAGTYSITAVYSGDNNTTAITSTILAQAVLNIATITLTSSINPVFIDNQTILTAVVTSAGVTPTGLVTFFDGAAPLGNASLVNGTASLGVSFPGSGTHILTAVYYGDAVTAGATSAAYSQTAADFSVAVATGMPATASILQGGTASYSLVLTPLITNTLPGTVVFSVSGLPKGATATFTPPSVAAGAGATPFILTINTPAITAELRSQPPPSARRYAPVAMSLLLLPLAAFARRRRLGKQMGSLLLLLLLAAGATGLTGCVTAASSGYYGVTTQTYNLTVTGTSGNLTRTTGLTLIVQ
jgi:sugar lactone lactonase YvrE